MSHPDAIDTACNVLDREIAGLEALRRDLRAPEAELGKQFSAAVAVILALQGRVVVTGIGKSGHIGRKIQATLSSTGTPALFVHPGEASHGDLGMIQPGDCVLALSNSGETQELGDIVAHARRFGLTLIAVTGRADSTLACAADIVLRLPAMPEACPMGLAPTTSTTMQLALGDSLAVALLDGRGFTASDFSVFHPGGKLGAKLRQVRELMRVGELMPLGAPEMSLREVIVEMTRKAVGCLGVTDAHGVLQGIITDGDLRRALERDFASTRALDVMNRTPLTVPPELLAVDALRIMNERTRPITSLFVLDSTRKPVGVLHVHDLLRAGVA